MNSGMTAPPLTLAAALEIADANVRHVPRETSGARLRHVHSLAILLLDLNAATRPPAEDDFAQNPASHWEAGL